jgi:hypothetical protein
MLALVVALGLGVALGSILLADRTDRAYPEFLRSNRVSPLVVNPSLQSTSMDAAIRDFDGVRSVHSSDLLFASVRATHPFRVSELGQFDEESMVQVLGSADGRFIDVDRPAVTDGRLPTRDDELFVSEEFREGFSHLVGRPIGIGDVVDVGFFQALALGEELSPDDVIEPLGVEHLRVVGYGHLPDEVFPDGVYPRQRLIVSADIAARYRCDFDFRVGMNDEEALEEMSGPPCSSQYRYYSLDLAAGTSLGDVRDQFQAAATRLTPALPRLIRENFGYFYISQDRAQLDDAVRQAAWPVVTALRAFGLVSGAATLVIFALALGRTVDRGDAVQRTLRALGAQRRTRFACAGAGCALPALVGLVLAVVVAAAVSRVGPLGSVRSVQPRVAWSLPGRVIVPWVGTSAVMLSVIAALVAGVAVTRADRRQSTRSPARSQLNPTTRRGPLAIVLGVRAAFGDRSAGASSAVLVGCVATVAIVIASVMFGSNLTHVVDTPAEYGWPWQAAVVTGSGYGDADPDAIEASLAGRPDVEDYRLYGFDPATRVDGLPVPVVFGDSGSRGTTFTVVSGRPAERPGEIVVGTGTADELGVEIGDTVSLASVRFDQTEATVVGTAVLPSIGSFVADRTGLGRGAFVPVDRDPRDGDPSTSAGWASFVAIRLGEGSDVDRFLHELDHEARGWDLTGQAPVVLRTVRPPEIVNIAEMRAAPLVLASILASALALGLTVTISVSVRSRRRDLAILKCLGLGHRALIATVWWQALTIVAVGLVIGVPVGIVIGRFAWRSFAAALGLVPSAVMPVAWLLIVAASGLVVGLIAASPSARSAARLSPAEVLRTS